MLKVSQLKMVHVTTTFYLFFIIIDFTLSGAQETNVWSFRSDNVNNLKVKARITELILDGKNQIEWSLGITRCAGTS